jgi:hypothetical protein
MVAMDGRLSLAGSIEHICEDRRFSISGIQNPGE